MDGTFSLGLRPSPFAPVGRINVHVARLQQCSLPVRPEKESEAHETTLLERKLEKGGRRAPSGVGILLGMSQYNQKSFAGAWGAAEWPAKGGHPFRTPCSVPMPGGFIQSRLHLIAE